MTEIAQVRQNTYQSYSEGQERVVRANRRGELVVCDFWTQLALDGRLFHMQVGTEDAPVNTCTTLDDTLAMFVVDGVSGTTLIPAYYECNVTTYAATTVPFSALLEIDRAKIRYSTGGTAYVPENLRTDRPRVSLAANAYVGPDITCAAKTAVPGSIELARIEAGETTPSGTNEPSDFQHNGPVYNARIQPMAVVVGVGSIVAQFGCATADGTGFASIDWAELDSDYVT